MTKVNVISGFLGAGKTTLIKKLLDEALKGEKIVPDKGHGAVPSGPHPH